MENVIISYKELGETPLECLERVRVEKGITSDVPMTYAGRLDPMAEGLLIILVGEECKDKQKYLDLMKEYEIEVLLGVQSDSYDVLGIVEKSRQKRIMSDFSKYVHKFTQPYPRYSSKIIAMKEVPEEAPTKEVEIYSIENLGSREISGQELARQAFEKIYTVKGDFRQGEIVKSWQEFAEKDSETLFSCICLRVSCSSGTYMRSLANEMGGLAWSIKRTKVGDMRI